ncbi:uncharacterized protein LOC121998758 [Zingiber officinale]|uniref:uncharacterized protein LOC121998758 n=1 Tax=Zingiber officinale TaxID=94328 RepID=UPI001C4B607F|nr:uncharacterized protein LOC121998758 [Zingiber officinale]
MCRRSVIHDLPSVGGGSLLCCSLAFVIISLGEQELKDIWPHPHCAWSLPLCLAFVRLLTNPKRKVHKPVKGALNWRLTSFILHSLMWAISDNGSIIVDSNDDGDCFTETSLGKHHSNGPDISSSGSLKFIDINRKYICRNVSIPVGEHHPDFSDHVSSILSAIYQHSICNLALAHPEVQQICLFTLLKSIMFLNYRCYFASIVVIFSLQNITLPDS